MAKIRKYEAVVYFNNGTTTEYTIYGKKKRAYTPEKNMEIGYGISIASRNRPGDFDWENDMVNGVFDSFEGTDWSKVIDIDY